MPYIRLHKKDNVITLMMEYFQSDDFVSESTLKTRYTENCIESAINEGYIRRTTNQNGVVYFRTNKGRDFLNNPNL